MIKKRIIQNKGQMLIQVVVFSTIAAYLIGAFASWVNANIRASKEMFYREEAIQIAEAGNEYYRWHLAHSPQDYKDGTTTPGPYIHNFLDKDANIIGQFSLSITPPPLGSTLVTIQSTGKTNLYTSVTRKITTKLAKPSLAKYAVVANNVMRFGSGTEVFGPIHSNNGIRFDGLAHNVITSAISSYNDPDFDDCNNNNSFGVHTCLNPQDPSPPTAVPARPDVFAASRQFPVPAVDFAGITANLAQMKTDAQASGFYRAGSGSLGYHVVLKVNDTFDLYKITSLTNPPNNCTNSQSQTGWGTWSINNQQLLGNYALPVNGIIFLEDDIWVDGQINTARVTIVAALLPDNQATRKNITVNTDLLYTNFDGSDTIGLIAQNNMNVGMISDASFSIDAALISQNGRAGRYYYGGNCSPYNVRTTLTLFGMIATNTRYGFAYTDGTGYQTRNINYDANLLYAPPPSFPLASAQYQTISWEENK